MESPQDAETLRQRAVQRVRREATTVVVRAERRYAVETAGAGLCVVGAILLWSYLMTRMARAGYDISVCYGVATGVALVVYGVALWSVFRLARYLYGG